MCVSVDYLLGRTDDPTPPDQDEFDPTADDWLDNAPQWLREWYEDPETRRLLDRSDVREVLLQPGHHINMKPDATEESRKRIRRDILQFIAWRLDQEKE